MSARIIGACNSRENDTPKGERRGGVLNSALLLSALPAGIVMISCSFGEVSEQHFVDNFETVVATSSRDHYTPYWLGYGFTAGGLAFKGPYTGDFAYEVDGGGVRTDYVASVGPRNGAAALTLTSYSSAAWAVAPARKSPTNPRTTRVPVMVGARQATLVRIPLDGRPNLFEVVFQLGDTTVVASAYVDAAHPKATPNPNPLVDEQTLLSVLANLRPYPQ